MERWEIVGEKDLPDIDDLMIIAFDISGKGDSPDAGEGLFVCNIGSNGGEYGCTGPVGSGERWPDSLRNARLIAAAPEMLAVLEELLETEPDTCNEKFSKSINKVRDVIRKAKEGV